MATVPVTAENFAVYRDKERQPITGFDAVDLASLPGADAAEVPVPARRHFLMLFDLSFFLRSLHPFTPLKRIDPPRGGSGPKKADAFRLDRTSAGLLSLGLPAVVGSGLLR